MDKQKSPQKEIILELRKIFVKTKKTGRDLSEKIDGFKGVGKVGFEEGFFREVVKILHMADWSWRNQDA